MKFQNVGVRFLDKIAPFSQKKEKKRKERKKEKKKKKEKEKKRKEKETLSLFLGKKHYFGLSSTLSAF